MIGPYAKGSPEWMVERCLKEMREYRHDLELYDNYLAGRHRPVYIPDNADPEFVQIAQRSPLNMIPLVVNSVTQVCYVDGFRHSKELDASEQEDPTAGLPPEMVVWQRNRMDARQLPAVQAFASHGIVYGLTVRDPKDPTKARLECYTAARACAMYSDPVNDVDPEWGLVIKKGDLDSPTTGRLFTETDWYTVTWDKGGITVTPEGAHGMSVCPLSRAMLHMDLEGRPTGLIKPLIQPQDQINQTSFDELTTQSWGAFKVRTATGLALPVKRWTRAEIEHAWPAPGDDATADEIAEYQSRPNVGDPILDQDGQQIPLPLPISQKRALVAEDPDVKWDTLDETPISPFLVALDARIKYLAAISQTPPTYFMGELANLSAEALQAAEISKTRRDDEIKVALAEMWERMLQLAMELEGESDRASDVGTEIVWADKDPSSFAATMDALGKMVEMLAVPPTFAWEMIPGMTQGRLVHLHQLKEAWEAEHPEVKLAATFEQNDIMSQVNDYETSGEATDPWLSPSS